MAKTWHLSAVSAAALLMAACGGERVDLAAELTGNGSATAEVRVEPERGRICWELSGFAGAFDGEVTAMHIHAGSPGRVGPVVLEFLSGNDACTEVGASPISASTLEDMADAPDAFYVDVHTTRHPDGAARGQLGAVDR
jgi:CHRD domain